MGRPFLHATGGSRPLLALAGRSNSWAGRAARGYYASGGGI